MISRQSLQPYILSKIILIAVVIILITTLFSCDKLENYSNNSLESIFDNSNNSSQYENSIISIENEINNHLQHISNNNKINNDSNKAKPIVTNIEEVEKIGLSKNDPDFLLLKAFLDGDTNTIERLGCFEKGTFDSYKTLKIGMYSIYYNENNILTITFNVIESGLDTLPIGLHNFYFVSNWFYDSENDGSFIFYSIQKTFSVQETLGYYFSAAGYEFFDINNLNDTDNYYISNYLLWSFGDLTPDQLQKYALELFGINNFQPGTNLFLENGLYYTSTLCSFGYTYDYIKESDENGIKTVTVQFYADAAHTIKSHIIEYNLKYVNGKWTFINSNIIIKSPYKPVCYVD